MEASALQGNTGIMRAPSAPPVLLRLRSDEQLVALFRAGNEEAFSVIHDRFQTRLLAYVRRMLPPGPRANAEDILQDVFLRAYGALRADARPIALRAWLYRVAHNRCIDELRRPGPQPTEIVEQEGDARLDPALAAERREQLRRLVVDLGRLPEQQRSALLMREIEGFTYQELGETLGVTQPAVKSLLVRARVGLAEAAQARDASCGEIREDLAHTRDRRVRSSARAKRHLRDCGECRSFDKALRSTTRDLGLLLPGPGLFGMIAGLLGLSGGAGGATAGGALGTGAAGVTGATGGGVAAATATKVAVAVCCVAATAGGGAAAVKVEHALRSPAPISAPAVANQSAKHVTAPAQADPEAAPAGPELLPAAAAPVPTQTDGSTTLPTDQSDGTATAGGPATVAGDSTDALATTGGAASPDEPVPASTESDSAPSATGAPTTTTAAPAATSATPATTGSPSSTDSHPATTGTSATVTPTATASATAAS